MFLIILRLKVENSEMIRFRVSIRIRLEVKNTEIWESALFQVNSRKSIMAVVKCQTRKLIHKLNATPRFFDIFPNFQKEMLEDL